MSRCVLMLHSSHRPNDGSADDASQFDDVAVPYRTFARAGIAVHLASPLGGRAPTDLRGIPDADPSPRAMRATPRRSLSVRDVRPATYDALFIADGQGALADLAIDRDVKRLVTAFAATDRIVASVGYGCAAFLDAKRADGRPFVAQRYLTTRSHEEEAGAPGAPHPPYDLRARLAGEGAELTFQSPRASHVVVDETLITGQNRRSAHATASTLLACLNAAPASASA